MLTFEYKAPTFLPELSRGEPLVMDSTASKYLKECFRKYFYRFVLGRIPETESFANVLLWGKTYHKFREVLEVVYGPNGEILSDLRGKEMGNLVQAMAVIEEYKPSFGSNDKFDFLNKVRLLQSIKKTIEWRTNEIRQGNVKILAVEQPFQVQLPDGSFTGGRIDQIIERNGKIWIRDFKTTSKQQNFYQRELDPNDQALRYIFGSSVIHYGDQAFKGFNQVQGVIFEVLYNSKTVGPQIYPILQSRNNFQIQNWVKDQVHWNEMLGIARTKDNWPMSETRGCTFCDYAEVCRAPSEGSMVQILKNKYKISYWDHTLTEQSHDKGVK